jgi:hypothetical protein
MRSAAVSEAATAVEFEYSVVRLLPFTVTVDCGTKFVPETLSTKPPAPARVPEGEMELMCGTGPAVGLTVNVNPAVVPPPG